MTGQKRRYCVAKYFAKTTTLFFLWFYSENLFSKYSVSIYLFRVNNRNTRSKYELCSKLTVKTPERRWRRSSVLLLTPSIVHTLFLYFCCWLWTSKYGLDKRLFIKLTTWNLIEPHFEHQTWSIDHWRSQANHRKLSAHCFALVDLRSIMCSYQQLTDTKKQKKNYTNIK